MHSISKKHNGHHTPCIDTITNHHSHTLNPEGARSLPSLLSSHILQKPFLKIYPLQPRFASLGRRAMLE